EIAQCTAMAAEMLGLKCTYLEAGSGAINSVSTEMIKKVADSTKTPLIVGGGIRDIETAKVICNAGADIIVVGTSIENNPNLVFDVFNAIQTVVNEKITS
ncbi:MAG: tRNA-dihydrouridine synthase, partial [Bacteroidetes bacterium]|nr:tRNA-dihydrouridine synthase [Bacteroidota bacterium]